jgi:hypothetical protein
MTLGADNRISMLRFEIIFKNVMLLVERQKY